MFAKTFDCLTMKEKFAGIIYFLCNESTNSVQQELHTSPKKKKMKTGKTCKTIWRNSLPHNMYRTLSSP